MTFRFGAAKPANPGLLTDSIDTDTMVREEIRNNEVEQQVVDKVLDRREPPRYIAPTHESDNISDETLSDLASDSPNKLSKLIEDGFPFDESQLEAIDGIANQRFACLTGAAGTGKTTCTKAIVDRIQNSLGAVDMSTYFKTKDGKKVEVESDEDDPVEEVEERIVPSICLVGFTGRSSQMIKKNFPRDWHGNIMTIHRMLAYSPEFYDEFDSELGHVRKKMRFTPTYNKHFLLPWDVIVIDEAGMVSVDLWTQVWDAAKAGCRIIMIGDINQLPPVHGRSIFGFAMTKWPSWELTHIHRQEGVNNSIVDNAWKVLKGIKPTTDSYKTDAAWKFAMMEVSPESAKASQQIRGWLERMNGKSYVPYRDSVITAINAEESSANGAPLGQIPMNRALAIVFNKDNPRFIIDAGRERKQFAVGDKVMATKNDHEVGITNGMTGVISLIERNGAYSGDFRRFGEVTEVNKWYEDEVGDDSEEDDFSLEDLGKSFEAQDHGRAQAKEAKDRGPASHIVTVRFGDGDLAFEIPFATLAEVASLMTAYVVTCHKMQGGESPLVVIICHQSHKSMLNREWLYTAITRASKKCVLFYTDMGLRAALSKQRIKGATLSEKVKVFQELQRGADMGLTNAIELADPESLGTSLSVAPVRTMAEQVPKDSVADEDKTRKLADMLAGVRRRVEPAPVIIMAKEVHLHQHDHHYHEAPAPTPPSPEARMAKSLSAIDKMFAKRLMAPPPPPTPALPARRLVSQWGAADAAIKLGYVALMAQRLLPCPVESQPAFPVEYVEDILNATQVVSADVAGAQRTSERPSESELVVQRAVKTPFRFGRK